MLVTVLLGILHLTYIVGRPVVKLSSPTYKRSKYRQATIKQSTKDYNEVKSSLGKVWRDSENFKKDMRQEFAGFRTQPESLEDLSKQLPPSQLSLWIFKLQSNGIIGTCLAKYRQKKIDDAEIRMVRLLTLGYNSLRDGRVVDARNFMKRAWSKKRYFQALQKEQVKAKIPSKTSVDNPRYRMFYEEFLIAKHRVSDLLKRGKLSQTKLSRALRQVADRRMIMEKQWIVPLEAPEDSDYTLMRRLVAFRKKRAAIQAAVLATQAEKAARKNLKTRDLVQALQNIRKAEVLQAKADRLRKQIPIPRETQINLPERIQGRVWVESEAEAALLQENQSSNPKQINPPS